MQKGFSSVFILIIAFLMILLFGAGIWYYIRYSDMQREGMQTEAPTPNTLSPTTTPTQSDVPEGWETYTSAAGDMIFAHPTEAQVREEVGGVNVSMLGPTQTEGTELFDGLSVTLSTAPLNGRPLQEVAQIQQAESAAEPVTENVTAVEEVTYAGKEGYRYTVTSLGTRDIIFLPYAEDLYLRVINSTVDPTNQGFQQMTEQIVATVREKEVM